MKRDFYLEVESKVRKEYFKPFRLGPLNLKNRFIVSPMYTALALNGRVNLDIIAHYHSLSLGGGAMVIVESTSIDVESKPYDHSLYLDSTNQLKYFTKLAKVIKSNNCVAGIQVTYCENNPNSSIILSTDEVDSIINKFVFTAILCEQAGFDVIEIHCGPGGLAYQFLMSDPNTRSDKFCDRSLFLEKILQYIKDKTKLSVIVRFSFNEYNNEAFKLHDSISVIKKLSHNIDIVHISSGSSSAYHGYQLDMASEIKISTLKPTIVSGLLQGEDMINYSFYSGKTDAIGIGRACILNPNYISNLELGSYV